MQNSSEILYRFPPESQLFRIYIGCLVMMVIGNLFVSLYGIWRCWILHRSASSQCCDSRQKILLLCVFGNLLITASWLEPRAVFLYDPIGTALFEMGELVLVVACLLTVHMFIVIHGSYHKASRKVARAVAIVCVVFTCTVIAGAITQSVTATSGNVSSQLGVGNFLMYGSAFVLELILLVGGHIYCSQVLQDPVDDWIVRAETMGYRDSRRRLLWLLRAVQFCCALELLLVVLSVFESNNWVAIPMNIASIFGTFALCLIMGRTLQKSNHDQRIPTVSPPAFNIQVVWPKKDQVETSFIERIDIT